jgi:hypothetical protein
MFNATAETTWLDSPDLPIYLGIGGGVIVILIIVIAVVATKHNRTNKNNSPHDNQSNRGSPTITATGIAMGVRSPSQARSHIHFGSDNRASTYLSTERL